MILDHEQGLKRFFLACDCGAVYLFPVTHSGVLHVSRTRISGCLRKQGVVEVVGSCYDVPLVVNSSHHSRSMLFSPCTCAEGRTVAMNMFSLKVMICTCLLHAPSLAQFPPELTCSVGKVGRFSWLRPVIFLSAHIPSVLLRCMSPTSGLLTDGVMVLRHCA